MKLVDIVEKSNLELHFRYKDKKYYLNMSLYKVLEEQVLLRVIDYKGKTINASIFQNPVLIYKNGDGVYKFSNIEILQTSYYGLPMYAVDGFAEVERDNRREAYRVTICEQRKLKVTTTTGKIIETLGFLKDISMTGMGLILNDKKEDINTIELSLDEAKSDEVKITSEVVRIIELPKHSGYLYGCRFYNPKESVGRYIIMRQARKHTKSQKS